MAYDISKAIARIEKEITESLIRNLKHHRAEETKEGFEWMQWQTVQLKELDRFKKQFSKKLNKEISRINPLIDEAINKAAEQGKMDEEVSILKALKGSGKRSQTHRTRSTFFAKDDKIDKLIKATTNDIAKAEHAILRRADDQYRRIIFDAQMYAASGAGTYAKAVDMATHDFLRAGINCVQYKNGARVSAAAYAEMAIRTATKRAYLQGQGEMRQEWGISTVILNKRTSACPLCAPFVGKVFIDDVWSGGKKSDGKYPLLSKAIEAGLYHPNCKDAHTTYFPGISTPPYDLSTRDLAEMEKAAKEEARERYCNHQAEKYSRLAEHSLDEDNQKRYQARADIWNNLHSEYADKLRNVEEFYSERELNRHNRISGSSSINTLEKLRTVSESGIINTNSISEIHLYLKEKYGLEALNFEKIGIEPQKIIFSAVDDMITQFPEIADIVKEIKYDSKLRLYGVTSKGFTRISKKGLNYETVIHELAHNLDIARGGDGLEYSKDIVARAAKNLSLRKNSRLLTRYRAEITGLDFKEAEKDFEVFAYAIETEKIDSKKGNALSKEIWRLVCSQETN